MQPRSLVWPARDGLRCLPGGLPNNRYAPTIRGGATSLQGAVGVTPFAYLSPVCECMQESIRNPRVPEARFPRRTLLGDSVNKRAATLRPCTRVKCLDPPR